MTLRYKNSRSTFKCFRLCGWTGLPTCG